MRVTLPPWPPLCSFLLRTALLVVIASALTRPAVAADDCSSMPHQACLRESLSNSGTARTLTVTILRQNSATNHYNVIVPGWPQGQVAPGRFVWVPVPDDGNAVYSLQDCNLAVGMSSCDPWVRIARSFAPVATCQRYADLAMTAVSRSDSLGCGFSGPRWDHNAQAHLNACLDFVGDWQGFVSNETNGRTNDLAACKARVAAASKPIRVTGGGGASTPDAVLSCQGGGGMQLTSRDANSDFIAFTPAAQPANVAPPGPGECAWPDRLFGNEAHRLAFSLDQPNAQSLLDAIRGGTFQVAARPLGGVMIMITAIDGVQVVDSTPLSSGPANNTGGAATTGMGSGNTGIVPPIQAGGSCGGPGAEATVVINQPGLDKLNVRNGPGGQVVGTVPEGGTVSVIGPCGAIGGAGLARTTTPGGGASGWCQISAPVHGCVSAQFLQFGGADPGTSLPSGAAGLAKSGGRPQTLASAAAGFGGNWSANAANVAYSISLKQSGRGVSGIYQGADGSGGRISGQVNGNVLRFAWVQKDGTKGSGKFVLSGDGRSFAGSYNFGNNPDAVEGSWNGMRQ